MFFLAVIVGVLMIYMDDIKAFISTRTTEQVNFNSLAPEQIQEGMYIKGEIRVVTDCYRGQEVKLTGKAVNMEFIIPVGDKYIGIYCEDSTMRLLAANMLIYQDACDRGDSNPEEGIDPVEIQGVIKSMKGKSLEAYEEYAALSMFPEKYLPYVLETTEGQYLGREKGLVSAACFAICFLVVIIYILVIAARGNLRTVTQYCRKRGNREAVYRELEEFFYAGRAVCDILRLDDTFFLLIIKEKVFFAETKDILWVYSTEDAGKFKILTVAEPNVIKVKMRDGSAISIGIQDVNTLRSLMNHIASRIPYIFVGYDREIEKSYKHNRYELIRMVERRRQDYPDAREREMNRRANMADTEYQDIIVTNEREYREEGR